MFFMQKFHGQKGCKAKKNIGTKTLEVQIVKMLLYCAMAFGCMEMKVTAGAC
jgi:hypothetical protein